MTSVPDHFNNTVVMAYDEGFPLLMPRWGYVVSAFVLFLIGFFGFFLNLLVILLMFKDRQLWTPLNIILFNLVCSDFSVSVLGNPLTLISALFHRWIFGRNMCVLYGFFMALLGITSITTLTVISFERYLMVTRPLSSRHLSSKGAALSVVFIWMYSLALTTPPLMGWGNYVNEAANISKLIPYENTAKYLGMALDAKLRWKAHVKKKKEELDLRYKKMYWLLGRHSTHCSVNWHEQSRNTMTYIMFLFAMGQILPLSIITFSYVNIIRTLKRNSQRLGRVSRAEARATAMVFIMIISFTVAWTPYSLFALIEQFATEGIISPGVGVIPALVAKSSICYDPLIYVGMNTQFRQAIKRVFGIHNKDKDSRAEKYNNTLMSPAHKVSSLNNIRMFSTDATSSQIPKIKDKKVIVTDEVSDAINNEVQRTVTKNTDLKTIQENKISDTERSGETISNDDSSSQNNFELFGESCKVVNKHSPELIFMDNEKLLFTKIRRKQDEDDIFGTGNEGYEEHPTDEVGKDAFATERQYSSFRNQKSIRQSFSLDLSHFSHDPGRKKRKMSVETKLESVMQPRGFLKETFIKLFDPDTKLNKDIVKSYLCDEEAKANNENEL